MIRPSRSGYVATSGIKYNTDTPIYVSPTFFGLCSQDWPWNGSVIGTPPSFSIGRLSTYDNQHMQWGRLHTSANNINWTNLDRWVENAKASGVVAGTYVLYGTPTFLASSGVSQAAPYGILGGGAYPGNGDPTLSQLSFFCQQFAMRNATAYERFFDTISLWNEPVFTQNPSASNYWWGSVQQFVDLVYTAHSAIKSIDPSLTTLTPGTYFVFNSTGGMDQWINAYGAINTSRQGKDCFDAAANHIYHSYPTKAYGKGGDPSSCILGGIQQLNALFASSGKSVSGFWATEWGISSGVDAELSWFLALPEESRCQFIKRLLVSAACYGYKAFYAFSLGNSANLSGDLVADTNGVILGYKSAYTLLAGKSIDSCAWNADGSISVTVNGTYSVI